MNNPMMKCGHVAQGEDENGKPVCVVCIGIVEGAREVAEEQPHLKSRKAECSQCSRTVESSLNLPFFEHNPNHKVDRYYCGCWGWN
jgi:hypothetical protein